MEIDLILDKLTRFPVVRMQLGLDSKVVVIIFQLSAGSLDARVY